MVAQCSCQILITVRVQSKKDILEIVFYSTHLQTVHWWYHHDKVIRKEATASV